MIPRRVHGATVIDRACSSLPGCTAFQGVCLETGVLYDSEHTDDGRALGDHAAELAVSRLDQACDGRHFMEHDL